MKINDNTMLECLHLDTAYLGLTVNNLMVVSESFNLLDVHNDELLNDLQVKIWMKHNTDLKQSEVVQLFELMDVYATGFFDLDTFYFFTTIMLCAKDNMEKDYINRHSRSIYNLFELRMRGKMTYEQFVMVGWLFGYETDTIKFFRKNFDVSKYMRIVHEEFKLYALICLELQRYRDTHERITAYNNYRHRLIAGMKDLLIHYVQSNEAPKPTKLMRRIRWTQKPYIRIGRGVRRLNVIQRIHKYCIRQFRMLMENIADRTKVCSCAQQCVIGCFRCSGFVFNKCTCNRYQDPQQKEKQKKREKYHGDQNQNQDKSSDDKKLLQKLVSCKKMSCCRGCLKCKKQSQNKPHKQPRRQSAWGEDLKVIKLQEKCEEVSEASRMPSWILRLDELKKKKKRGAFTLQWIQRGNLDSGEIK